MKERQSSIQGTSAPCSFRISSEGLPLLLPYITKQILHASLVDFKHLLQYKSIKFSDFVDSEFREKALELLPGCCVIVLRKGINSGIRFILRDTNFFIMKENFQFTSSCAKSFSVQKRISLHQISVQPTE